ncbi:hypothetical protein [Streptosporangium sp. NPDC002721]
MVLFAHERNASIRIDGHSESEALAVLDSLRPVTAKTLAARMSTRGRT